jgi:NAD(P)H dehydrogenase (quinone)
MSTVVTGASGHPGRLVVDQLLTTRTPPADVADPSTLRDALGGADAMPLVSTTTVGC